MSRSGKIALAAILAAAALARLWGAGSYFPHFWDEAKYVEEVDGLLAFFSVNVLSYAFLKLGRAIIGPPSYPQVVTALAGVMTVLGLFCLGRRIVPGKREGTQLGLLMAACAAVMPYYVLYARHALAAGFALCFFVYALFAYVARLQYPPVRNRRARMQYLRRSAIAALLLALVPACSFNFLLPTALLFVLMEMHIWRVRSAQKKEYRATQTLVVSLIGGGLLFALIPLGTSVVFGYSGWLDRAIALSEFHAQIKTMRPAFNFLYPVHLYYLAGPVLMACVAAGAVLMGIKRFSDDAFSSARPAHVIMVFGFAIYVLFYGAFSHLQSARLYALSLPFVAYAAAFAILRSGSLFPKIGRIAVSAVVIVLLGSMSVITLDYLSRTSGLPAACDETMKYVKREGMIYTNAKTQVYHCAAHSPNNRAGLFRLNSFLHASGIEMSRDNPPVVVIQEGIDLVSTVASQDKQDALQSIDTIQIRMEGYLSVAKYADLVYAAPDDFYTSPYYYLEDVYSWRSYIYIRRLMPSRRDSVFVYRANPTRYDIPSPAP